MPALFYDPTKVSPPDVYGATTVVPENQCEAPLEYGSRPPAGWDYVLAFHAPASTNAPISANQRRIDAARISVLHDLQQAFFHYSQLWVPSSRLILVRIAMPESVMMEKANFSGLKFRTRPEYSGGYIDFLPQRFFIFENFNRRLNGLPYFTPAERLMLTQLTLASNDTWGADVSISALIRDGLLKHAFGLHVRRERNMLVRACMIGWWSNPLRAPPLYALQEYLGTQVALYLAWILFFTRMQVGFALFSIVIYVILTWGPGGDVEAWTYLVYGMGIVFWGTYWVRNWQRRNAVINVQWGQSEGEEDRENMIRDNFVGTETEGFYSLGGFVHLSDLAEQTELTTTASLTNAAHSAQEEEHEIDDTVVVDDDGAGGGIASNSDMTSRRNVTTDPAGSPVHTSARTTLTALMSGHGSTQQVITIGDDSDRGDVDFTLEAAVVGRTFPDLPRFPYSSISTKRMRMRVSGAITLAFSGLVAFLSFAILLFRKEINVFVNMDPDSGVFTGIITALIIMVSDGTWKSVSVDLTNWENHHTSKAWEDSIIMKRFAFQFVSNYVTLFYIAFAKPFLPNDPCMVNYAGTPDCMLELQTQLTSVVVTKATVEQVLELLVPKLLSFVLQLLGWVGQRRMQVTATNDSEELARLSERGAVVDSSVLNWNVKKMGMKYLSRSLAEEDEREENDVRATLDEQRRMPYDGTVDDYGEIIVQYGFVALFGVAFPLAAVVNLVNNLLEFRTDTFKILAVSQRPPAEIGTSIGRWMDIVSFLANLSVVTIVGLLTITTPQLPNVLGDLLPEGIGSHIKDSPVISFVAAEHLLFVIRWVVTSYVEKVPDSTYRLRARRSFLIAKCLKIGWKPYFGGGRHRPSQSIAEL